MEARVQSLLPAQLAPHSYPEQFRGLRHRATAELLDPSGLASCVDQSEGRSGEWWIDESDLDDLDVTPQHLAELARHVAREAETALNPLHKMLIVADALARSYHQSVKGTDLEAVFRREGWGQALASAKTKRLPASRTIEQAGVLGAYVWLAEQPGTNVLFVNDLASEHHGIDAVAHCPKRDRFLILESKGTTRPLTRTLSSYLGQTRHKGRQLSQEWCWSSIFEFALLESTAPISLRLAAPFLEGQCDRVLVVSHVVRTRSGYRPDYWRCCEENDLSAVLPLDSNTLRKQRGWLAEIRASGALAKFGANFA